LSSWPGDPDPVVVFGGSRAAGVEELTDVGVLGHRCENSRQEGSGRRCRTVPDEPEILRRGCFFLALWFPARKTRHDELVLRKE